MARMRKSSVKLLIAIVFYFCFLLLGAAIFLRIERPKEERAQHALKMTYQEFLEEHKQCVAAYELDDFIKTISDAGDRGIKESLYDEVKYLPSWDFGQAIFFAATTLTTIGYGHVSKLSNWGKVFCIIYVLIGIPYTLILLTAILERLGHVSNKLLKWVNNRYGNRYTPFKIRLIHLGSMVFLLVLFFFVIPSLVFAAIEPFWNFLDSFYYCFISFTTIGYGDYVPGEARGQKLRAIYKIAVTIFLLVGLLFMALLLTIAYEIPQLNLSHMLMEGSDDDSSERSTLNPNSMNETEPKYVRHVDEVESPTNQSPFKDDIRQLHP